jgi:dihydroflavonol-4-reductase
MLVLVTGATGFLGSHVARVLAAQGAELRLLVRPTSDLERPHRVEARGLGSVLSPKGAI